MNLKDKQGRYLTQALFWETRREGISPIFTMASEDRIISGVRLISLKNLYMTCEDPTEAEFVKVAFDGDWEHWRRIKTNDLLATKLRLNEWPGELELHLRSIGVLGLIQIAKDKKHRSNASAAKWLAEAGWKDKQRGRPSEEELEGRAKTAEKFGADFPHIEDLLGKMNG